MILMISTYGLFLLCFNGYFRRKNETIKAMVESEEDNFEKSTTEIETLSHKIKQIENLNETLRTPGLGSPHSKA